MNVLKPQRKNDLEALLRAKLSYREIESRTGTHRETVSRYARILGFKEAKPASRGEVATGFCPKTGQDSPARPPDGGALERKISDRALSACEPQREWIQQQVGLGRNAQSIYQDLVEQHGFLHKYNSVKRFVRGLKRQEPERFDVLEFLPGEEAQVDYGQGALTLFKVGKYKRPYLFVMTLKYSGKSFRKVVWKTSQEIWAKLHEEAFRSFGGCPQYVVLDNLKEGVLKPDVYDPILNPVYVAMLAHYGVVAQPCRVGDPNRKGTVESAIGHTQGTALKGRRFETVEAQNTWLSHWEEHWAAPRIHGRKKRQVMQMFLEEKPNLLPLPAGGFRYFKEEQRTVDDAGLVQVKGSYYCALPAKLYSAVKVRIFENEIEIWDLDGLVLRRHQMAQLKGEFKINPEDRIFNPTRETERLLARVDRIGPSTAQLARGVFLQLGRAGSGAIYGLSNLVRTYKKEEIEAACAQVLKAGCSSYRTVKRLLERGTQKNNLADLQQTGSEIRPIHDYQAFWDTNSQINQEEIKNDDVYH